MAPLKQMLTTQALKMKSFITEFYDRLDFLLVHSAKCCSAVSNLSMSLLGHSGGQFLLAQSVPLGTVVGGG